MSEANYAADKYGLIHRGLSLLILVGIIAMAVQDGQLSIGRSIMQFVIPISCIWFPDAIAALKDDVINSRIVRFGGWCLFLIMIGFPIFLKSLTS